MRRSCPKIVALLGLLSFVVGCASSQNAPADKTKAQLNLQLGTRHFLNGNYPEALKALLEAERLDPKDPVVQNNLGLTFMMREKFDQAEQRFLKALAIDPKFTDARNNLGRLYIDVGMYAKAIRELEAAANDLTYSQPDKSWANLGEAFFFNKDYERAKVALQNSLKTRRESCPTQVYYGRTLFELNSFKSAAESFDNAAKVCDKTPVPEVYFFGAMSLYKSGDMDRAKARFTETATLFPQSIYARKANEMLEIIK